MHFSANFLRLWAGVVTTVLLAMGASSCGGSSGGNSSLQGPMITSQPASATISSGQTANLSVSATGSGSLTYQWYQGSSGDTSKPVGTNSSSFTSSPLSTSTSFWVNVSDSGGNSASSTASITVVTPPANAIPAIYMGMQMNGGINGISGQQPWPVVPFGAVRLWDADVSWYDNVASAPTPGTCDPTQYNWTKLDAWLSLIPQHGADVLYTFGRTPAWASSNPTDTTCGFAPGSCDPPSDVNADGSGTDQFFKDYVTCVVQHSVQSSTGHIKYYELWNEIDNPPTWTGTYQQTARMTSDAIQIIQSTDPNAVIVSPSYIIENTEGYGYLQSYLQALSQSALQAFGAIAFHGYVQQSGRPLEPENIVTYLNQAKPILSAAGLGSKPLFDTEASWGDPTVSSPAFTDPDMQAGFLARMYLLQWSEGVSRFYWYQWNNKQDGILWTPDPNNPAAPGTVLPAGVAYGQVYQWLVGTVMSQACGQTGSVWTCELTSLNGYQALAVWDASQSCSNGNCTTSNYTFPPQYIQYRDLTGNTMSLAGQTSAPIGARPILLENQSR
jgi:Ig-like domain CHU_C associated